MIKDITQLKAERPDLVETFKNMTKVELLNQCYLECIDAINMEERVAVFMEECTVNMSNTNYTPAAIRSLINEKIERDIKDFCSDLLNSELSKDEIIGELQKYANGV